MVFIRGKEYKITKITDVILKELSDHGDETKSRECRHRNTFNLLRVVLDPPLPEEFFLPDIGLLLLNDTEIVGIISAAAEALSQDENFTGSLSGLEALIRDNPEAQGAIAQLRNVLGKPAEVREVRTESAIALPQTDKIEITLSASELALINALRSAKAV